MRCATEVKKTKKTARPHARRTVVIGGGWDLEGGCVPRRKRAACDMQQRLDEGFEGRRDWNCEVQSMSWIFCRPYVDESLPQSSAFEGRVARVCLHSCGAGTSSCLKVLIALNKLDSARVIISRLQVITRSNLSIPRPIVTNSTRLPRSVHLFVIIHFIP